MSEAQFQIVDIEQLKESPLNPRQHYDEKKLDELAESMGNGVGVIEPLVVRGATNGDFEIIAGSRRYRAAKKARVTEIPVMVRDLDDTTALEIMVIENDQREDTNALEQAEGYSRLMQRGYTVERIAERTGQSAKWVYDRVKLLQLIPEAKKLLLSDRITPGHAILLARLKPAEQKRTIDPENFDVWKHENLLFAPDAEPDEDPVKIVSVRELESWIDQHIRFDRKAPIDPMLFPDTAATVKAAVEEKEKVIQITHNYQTPPDAKEGNTERIWHVSSWKLADSKKGVPGCPKSKIGVIVVGPERGEAFRVCTDKECPVHWAKEKREREKRAKAGGQDGQQDQWKAAHARQQAEYEKQEREREEWKKVLPAINKACAEKLKAAKLGVFSEIVQRWDLRGHFKEAIGLLGKPKTFEDLARFMGLVLVMAEACGWNARSTFPPRARRLGVDIAAILKAHRKSEESVQTTAKKKVKGENDAAAS